MKICKGEDISESNSSDKIIELRPDGRPKRDIKKKMHFDEKYPPEEQTPKKRKPNSKIFNRNGVFIDTPVLSRRKSSVRRTKFSKEVNELNSDDEEYKAANKKVKDIKGRLSSSFLIRKYINKIKYCFDKLKVLSPKNQSKDINLNEKDIDCVRESQSSGYSYLKYDMETDKLNIVLSRISKSPFIRKEIKTKVDNNTENSCFSFKESPAPQKNEDTFNFKEEISKIKFEKLNPDDVYGSYKAQNNLDNKLLAQNKREYSGDISGGASEKDSSAFKGSKDSSIGEKDSEPYEIYDFIKVLEPNGLQEEGLAEMDYENLFFEKSKILNIDIIRLRAYYGYYHRLQNFYDDIMQLLKYTLSKKCKNMYAKYYLSELIYYTHNLFKDKGRIEKFNLIYKEDLNYRFSINLSLKVHGKWNKVIGSQREYIPVDEYINVVDDNDAFDRLKTSKTSICKGGC